MCVCSYIGCKRCCKWSDNCELGPGLNAAVNTDHWPTMIGQLAKLYRSFDSLCEILTRFSRQMSSRAVAWNILYRNFGVRTCMYVQYISIMHNYIIDVVINL